MSTPAVPYYTTTRQWDSRFNVPTDLSLKNLVDAIKCEAANGKFKWVLVSGPEIGDVEYRTDFGVRHVHVCLWYNNNVTKASILKNLKVVTGHGYYLVPRNHDLPLKGWKEHALKVHTKCDVLELKLFEYGVLPMDAEEKKFVKRSMEEKKKTTDEVCREIIQMLKDKVPDAEIMDKYPRLWLTYGEKCKASMVQRRDFFKTNGDPHIWLSGAPGYGKSAILQVVYPHYYNKDLNNRFTDLFNPEEHTHFLLQDVDHAVVEKLGVQYLKTICDEAGFPIDQKYKSPQLVRTTVLVTSNFVLADVIPEDLKGRREAVIALSRRFFQIDIKYLLFILGVNLIPAYDLSRLKREKNMDPRKCFMTWDWARNIPMGEDLKTAEEYQQIIQDKFYGTDSHSKKIRRNEGTVQPTDEAS